MGKIDFLFNALWRDYTQRLCPSASKVHALLYEGVPLINDHIALRTFGHEKTSLMHLAAPFIELGYVQKGEYNFKEKKLYGRHFEHPDLSFPKVFISELLLKKCSLQLQETVENFLEEVDESAFNHSAFLYSGRMWDIDLNTYQQLANESEYAAWVAAHGFGANHFTVSVNHLHEINEIDKINSVLRQAGFVINTSGGDVKGSPDVYLEQSATMADIVPVFFNDHEWGNVKAMIPGGFYEFAKRYSLPSGALFQGFVEASADKIFESTDK